MRSCTNYLPFMSLDFPICKNYKILVRTKKKRIWEFLEQSFMSQVLSEHTKTRNLQKPLQGNRRMQNWKELLSNQGYNLCAKSGVFMLVWVRRISICRFPWGLWERKVLAWIPPKPLLFPPMSYGSLHVHYIKIGSLTSRSLPYTRK